MKKINIYSLLKTQFLTLAICIGLLPQLAFAQNVEVERKATIGTGGPISGANLEVNGDVFIGGGENNFDGDYETLRLRGRSKDWNIGVTNQAAGIGGGRADFFISQTPGEGTFYISNSGGVGIGTNSPLFPLDVNGNANFNRSIFISDNLGIGTTAPTVPLDVNGDATIRESLLIGNPDGTRNNLIRTGQEGRLVFENDGEIRMVIGDNGDQGIVGINTNSPEAPLDVDGDVHIGGGSSKSDGDAEILRIKAESSDWIIGATNSTEGNSDFFIGKTANPLEGELYLTNGGNLGIGTTLPQSKLHVAGRLTLDKGIKLRNPDSIFFESNTGVLQAQLKWDGNKLFLENKRSLDDSNLIIRTEGGDINFRTGSTNTLRMSLTSDGSIDIPSLEEIGNQRNVQWDEITGQLGFDTSSKRYKENIRNLEVDFQVLLDAIPKTYTRSLYPDRWEIGFIAEDFHDLGLSPLVEYDQLGRPDGIDYDRITIYLVPLLKSQKKEIDELKKELKDVKKSNNKESLQQLEEEIVALREMVTQLMAATETSQSLNKQSITLSSAKLYPNQPNPFHEKTIIRYHIPEESNTAKISISDLKGNIIKTIPIQTFGQGELSIEAALLNAGTYIYSLIIDGEYIATEKMILTK